MSVRLKEIVDRHNCSGIIETIQNELKQITDDEKIHVVLFSETKSNPALPQLKYLNGIVLKTISDGLPDHPPVAALYNFFEELFAPVLTSTINGNSYEYYDLKKTKVQEFDSIIDDIIKFAKSEWSIDVLTKIESRQPKASEAYINAYANQWDGLEEALKSN